jgi:hypothetical protein
MYSIIYSQQSHTATQWRVVILVTLDGPVQATLGGEDAEACNPQSSAPLSIQSSALASSRNYPVIPGFKLKWLRGPAGRRTSGADFRNRIPRRNT